MAAISEASADCFGYSPPEVGPLPNRDTLKWLQSLDLPVALRHPRRSASLQQAKDLPPVLSFETIKVLQRCGEWSSCCWDISEVLPGEQPWSKWKSIKQRSRF